MDMDMSGMGMSMDSGSSALFLPDNQLLARAYWYAIAAGVAVLTAVRLFAKFQLRQSLRRHSSNPDYVPWRPTSWLGQSYATMTAIFRESAYPQPCHFSGAFSKYFTPLPLGHWLLLTIYWTFLLTCLWTNVILSPDDAMYPYRWEKVGFRAAWISVTQVPFIYLLSAKLNPITFLTGISYERFNWFHRWSARTLFLTVIVHWSFFFQEWALADFVQTEIQMMPVVVYGFAAWAVIGWMVISSFGVLRAKAHEFFVLQHIAAAGALLWLLYKHVPAYAQYNIWMSVGFVAFDWSLRIVWNTMRNLHVFGSWASRCIGYRASLEVLPGDMVRMTVEDVDFNWKAGQHAFVSVPWLRPFELHPFTIANTPETSASPGSGRDMTFVIKAQRGFSRSLYKAASKSGQTYTTLLSGPWGHPPELRHLESVVLIATSTGASFTTPIFDELVKSPGCVRTIVYHWIISQREHFAMFEDKLTRAVHRAEQSKLEVRVVVHITRDGASKVTSNEENSLSASDEPKGSFEPSVKGPLEHAESATTSISLDEESSISTTTPFHTRPPPPGLSMRHEGRPTVQSMIRGPVEAATGETGIVICGGPSITAQARTFVAALSDERAVHKGSGAQGIFLYVETYGW